MRLPGAALPGMMSVGVGVGVGRGGWRCSLGAGAGEGDGPVGRGRWGEWEGERAGGRRKEGVGWCGKSPGLPGGDARAPYPGALTGTERTRGLDGAFTGATTVWGGSPRSPVAGGRLGSAHRRTTRPSLRGGSRSDTHGRCMYLAMGPRWSHAWRSMIYIQMEMGGHLHVSTWRKGTYIYIQMGGRTCMYTEVWTDIDHV